MANPSSPQSPQFARGASGAGDVLQLFMDGAAHSRTDLAALTGMARSTLQERLDVLISLGLIGTITDGASTGGRPPQRLALLPDARLILAIDLGASHLRVALTDLSPTLVAQSQLPISFADGPVAILESALVLADELLASQQRTREDVIAIGMGVPGPVNFETGRPANPPIMPGWDGFDIPAWFQQHLDALVVVDNDVNLMAIGEKDQLETGSEDFIFVKLATGIGSGIISGGLLQRGAQGTAGDIGHVRIRRGDGIFCHCGNEGCLEAVAAGPKIATALREQGIEAHSNTDVVALVNSGNIQAIHAVRQAGRDLGEVLAASVSLLNPSLIVVGGRISAAGEHLLAGIREVVYQRGAPLSTQHLQIRTSLSWEVGALRGASMIAINQALSPAAIERSALALISAS
ncbi:ROK family protein [Glutamicibacter arilaitensis]|uniref:ROK family transcriptional regulator n=1 Tax=Glutamicibacter arilaitensis TaxID=256701 RepID=A0A4Y8TVL9_9MICC|nr:ROK family protein [Glutamicibacter arilaitensis]TFH56230.1 ROK family transcriptional regulator [Glutamicibacter arilaitensis]